MSVVDRLRHTSLAFERKIDDSQVLVDAHPEVQSQQSGFATFSRRLLPGFRAYAVSIPLRLQIGPLRW